MTDDPIMAKWHALGGAGSFLGEPVGEPGVCPDGVGRFRHFQGGSIHWHPTTGAHETHGAIRALYAELGWEQSFLGYPVADERDVPLWEWMFSVLGASDDGSAQVDLTPVGRCSRFQGGVIYWRRASSPLSSDQLIVRDASGRLRGLRPDTAPEPVGVAAGLGRQPTEVSGRRAICTDPMLGDTVNEYNREAFLTALRATVVTSFHEARAVLLGIAEERITDPEVAKYVEFCKDLAQYCIDHGIQRGSNLNLWSVLIDADKEKAARTVLGRWWQRGIVGPVASVVQGGWLAVRLRGWLRLQEQLRQRYDPTEWVGSDG